MENIYDELRVKLTERKVLDKSIAKTNAYDGELEEKLDGIESDFIFNVSKLDDIASLESRDEEMQRKFIKMKLYIESMDFSEKGQLQLILTSASILNRVNMRTQDLTDSEFCLLAKIMVPLPLEDYEMYGDVLANPLVIKSILQKTDDCVEQLDMANNILDYCDEFVYENMNEIHYQKAIKDVIGIVSRYQPKEKAVVK